MNSPMKIAVQPMLGAEPLMCRANVSKRIKAMGGKAVYGWNVRHDPYNDVLQSHCVWEDDENKLWDVTPVVSSAMEGMCVCDWPDETEFVRDDDAAFKGKALPSRYISTHPHPRVATACQYMERGDMRLYAGDLDGCRYWTDKANTEIRKARLPFAVCWDSPHSLSLEAVFGASN